MAVVCIAILLLPGQLPAVIDRAIEAVLVEYAKSPNLLCPRVAARVDMWIGGYVDRDDRKRLRSLLRQITTSAGDIGTPPQPSPPPRLVTIRTRRAKRSAAS